MVDEPHPIERTGADPVTPSAVHNRANEVFGGIDLGIPGTTSLGLGTITVGGDYEGGNYFAEAKVNGILVASMATEGDLESICFSGEEPGGATVTVQLKKTPDGETIDIKRRVTRHMGTTNVHQFVEWVGDPSERTKIAQIMGIKV